MSTENVNIGTNFQFEHFFELSADLCCIAGFDGYFKRINPSVSRVLGYSNEELFSRPINDFVHPGDKEITARVRYELTQNKPLLNFENRYITKSGEIVWLSWTSIPVYDEKLVFAIAKNITHTKKLEEDRNNHLSELTRANKEFKQFVYSTSHDLRSPVNSLLSIINLLDVILKEDTRTTELMEILRKASLNLKQTLNDYVDTLIQKRSLNEQVEELTINQSLQSVLQTIHALVQSSKAEIDVDFSGFKTVKFNRAYLDSIFLNLITNSIKYGRPDLHPKITIRTTIVDGTKQLIVSDNGIGFDMEKVKDRIFGFHQKFHRHEDSKGIGLYLIYNHITNLGGSIRVESKVNEGATFFISFRE